MMKRSFHKGDISITHPDNLDPKEDYVVITVNDAISYAQITEIRVPIVDFALALMGRSCLGCQYELTFSHLAGATFEKKDINIGTGERGVMTEELAIALIAPHEVDGWRGNTRDACNHHRWTPKGVKVGFVRYLDGDGKPIEKGLA